MITRSLDSKVTQTATAAMLKTMADFQPSTDFAPFVSRIKATGSAIDFAWFGAIDYPVEWGGGRAGSDIKAYTDQLVPVAYGRTYDIDADTLSDDQTQTLTERLKGVGEVNKDHANLLASQFVEAGTAGTIDTSYDGQFVYDTDHDESGSNQSNDLTGAAATGTAPTPDEFESAIGAAFEAGAAFKNDKGNPMGLTLAGATIEVPPAMMLEAMIVLGPGRAGNLPPELRGAGGGVNASDQSGVQGIFRNTVSWMVNYHSTNTDRFRVHWPATAAAVGPMVLADREDWRVKYYDPFNDKDCDDRNLVQVKTRARFKLGPGLWQKTISYIFT